jgi:hypothetical protein
MIRVSEHRRRVSAEKRNERNERPMSGVPAKAHSVFRRVHVHPGEEALTK